MTPWTRCWPNWSGAKRAGRIQGTNAPDGPGPCTGRCISHMRTPLNRRQFLKQTTVIGTSLATMRNGASLRAGGGANNKIVVAVMGTNGRGMDHIQSYLAQSNVEVGCICDLDSRAIDKGVAA